MDEPNWMADIDKSIADAISFMTTVTKEADPKDPDVIKAVCETLKIMADIRLSVDVVVARSARTGGGDKSPNALSRVK